MIKGRLILKTFFRSLVVLFVVFMTFRIFYAQQHKVPRGITKYDERATGIYNVSQQDGNGERHPNRSYGNAADTTPYPSKIVLNEQNDSQLITKKLPAEEKYECSISRPIHPTRYALLLQSKSTQEKFRIKLACKHPSQENRVYTEILSSAVGEFFGTRSYPLAHGMILHVNQLIPVDSVFSTRRGVYRCVWDLNGSSIIAGAATPYLSGLKKIDKCEDFFSDMYGVALQWLLDLLTGNNDRKCRLNSFRDENTGLWQSLDNDRLAISIPGFCNGLVFPELERPFFMPDERFPSTKAIAHVRKFCDIANITMSILHRGLKGGNRDVGALEEYIIHQVTEDDFFAKFVPLYFRSDEEISKSREGVKEIFRRGLNYRNLRDECIPAVDTLPSTIPSIIAHVFARVFSVRSSALVPKLRTVMDKLCT